MSVAHATNWLLVSLHCHFSSWQDKPQQPPMNKDSDFPNLHRIRPQRWRIFGIKKTWSWWMSQIIITFTPNPKHVKGSHLTPFPGQYSVEAVCLWSSASSQQNIQSPRVKAFWRQWQCCRTKAGLYLWQSEKRAAAMPLFTLQNCLPALPWVMQPDSCSCTYPHKQHYKATNPMQTGKWKMHESVV